MRAFYPCPNVHEAYGQCVLQAPHPHRLHESASGGPDNKWTSFVWGASNQ